ncbi:MAG TPA: response regulator [Burkholderiales bacterium]|nr:response regulator [Burkholderiales bacterium]
MPWADHLVLIVDDDAGLREALQDLLAASGLRSVALGSAAEYLAYPRPDVPACVILDVELPDINGLDLQRQIADQHHPPIIFITGHGSIATSVRAIKAGALDFLTKPFDDQELLNLVRAALELDRERRVERAALQSLAQRFESLTPREREVLPLVVSGLLNKQAAAQLGISEVTFQIHRSNVMRKMAADSFADLVRIAGSLNIPASHDRRG